MTRLVFTLVLAFQGIALGLKTKETDQDFHVDQEGSEDEVSKETIAVFTSFDANKDEKLDLAEFRNFQKTPQLTQLEFRNKVLAADPYREKGQFFLTQNDLQMLVNIGEVEGSKILETKEKRAETTKEWLDTRQYRHKSESAIKDAMVQHGDAMVEEIFDAFDSDKDGWLLHEEFNTIQKATEGDEGIYDPDQFHELLEMVAPNREKDGLNLKILKGMYLNKNDADEFQTELPGDYSKLLKEGKINGKALPGEEKPEEPTANSFIEDQSYMEQSASAQVTEKSTVEVEQPLEPQESLLETAVEQAANLPSALESVPEIAADMPNIVAESVASLPEKKGWFESLTKSLF